MNRARLLRKRATAPERILWRHLRNRNFAGYKFRRQHPLDPYTLDFYCSLRKARGRARWWRTQLFSGPNSRSNAGDIPCSARNSLCCDFGTIKFAKSLIAFCMKTDQPLFLNEEQVREHLRMTELIPAMEKALMDFSAGRVTQPVRSIISIDLAAATGFLGLMPALTPDGLGLKAVTFYPSNAERGIPTHMATIFLVDPQTGTPLAIMDGRYITEMRTAAVSAAATKLLASPDARCSPFSAAECKRAAMWKPCGSLGNLKKFACGVLRLCTQSGSHRKLAP